MRAGQDSSHRISFTRLAREQFPERPLFHSWVLCNLTVRPTWSTVNPLLHLEELPETGPTEQLKVTPSSCTEGAEHGV